MEKLSNLISLDISYNNLTVESKTSQTFPQIYLASCKLSTFPDLRNQSNLYSLDLSDNQITGLVPRWIWKVGNGSLLYLNISHNQSDGLEPPYSIPNLDILDLHSNRLKGRIPPFPPEVIYVDFSNNNFYSAIPEDIGNNISFASFFSLSNNSLTGVIPGSICNATSLLVLDLSNNVLDGEIPACLIERSERLGVLNLRGNKFNGSIPDNFPRNCGLRTLDMSVNQLDGRIPQSLINCSVLEVLDLGSNEVNDMFPCLLINISSLRVLILRNNNFQGNLKCLQSAMEWIGLQIIDIASNNFSGALPSTMSAKWKAMMGNGDETHDHLKVSLLGDTYYQDSITVTYKGLELKLVKILKIFTSIDFSNNNFEGPIPENFGQLNALYILNLSHNALEGQIPASLGKISHLESFDLSVNKLSGSIPVQLADLTFLSFLNLSYNRLVGKILTSTQLQSFTENSFAHNAGLCGPPLSEKCIDPTAPPIEDTNHSDSFSIHADRNFIVSIELRFIFGLAIVIGPLLYSKRWRVWYYNQVDPVLYKIFPRLNPESKNIIRRAHANRRRRH